MQKSGNEGAPPPCLGKIIMDIESTRTREVPFVPATDGLIAHGGLMLSDVIGLDTLPSMSEQLAAVRRERQADQA